MSDPNNDTTTGTNNNDPTGIEENISNMNLQEGESSPTTPTTTTTTTTTLDEDNVVIVNRIMKLSDISSDMIIEPNDLINTTSSTSSNTNMICIYGWIYSVRVQGAGSLIFIDLNDGSIVTPIRCLAEYYTNTNNNTTSSTTTEEGQGEIKEEEGKEGTTTSSSTNSSNNNSIFFYDNTTNIITDNTSDTITTKYGYYTTDMNNHNTTTLQIINDITYQNYKKLSFDQLSQSTYCCIGCSCLIFGYITKPPDNTSTQKYEMKIKDLYIIGNVADASKYPIQKSILKKPISLRNYSHTRFRAPIIQQFMMIRSTTLYTIHEYFYNHKIPCCDPNIITNNDCEGAGEIFTLMNSNTFFHIGNSTTSNTNSNTSGQPPPKVNIIKSSTNVVVASDAVDATTTTTATTDVAATTTTTTTPTCNVVDDNVGLTVSSQLPLEAIAMGTGAVYTCQKSFRAEKSDTNKHLAEFLHIEYECYFITLYELMNQVEDFVKTIISTVLLRCTEQYNFLNSRTTGPPEFQNHNVFLQELINKPFIRLTHHDAITILLNDVRDKVLVYNPNTKQQSKLKFKVKPEYGEDLGSEHEKYLVSKYNNSFVFITHWPKAIKSFYMKQDDIDTSKCESFDLLAPIVGELFGGSIREWRYNILEQIMKDKHMNDTSTLQWYMDLRKDGTAPHGGWGMGFDRLVMLLTNTQSVRDIVPYPIYYGHCPY